MHNCKQARSSRQRRRSAHARQDEAVRQIVLADNALRTSLSAYSASQSLTAATQTTFDAALASYRRGVGSITDLNLAETNCYRPSMRLPTPTAQRWPRQRRWRCRPALSAGRHIRSDGMDGHLLGQRTSARSPLLMSITSTSSDHAAVRAPVVAMIRLCLPVVRRVLKPVFLTATTEAAPGTSELPVLIATTRQRDARPGTLFNGERSDKLDFATVTVSIPPTHAPGEIEWPAQSARHSASEFVAAKADYLDGEVGFVRMLMPSSPCVRAAIARCFCSSTATTQSSPRRYFGLRKSITMRVFRMFPCSFHGPRAAPSPTISTITTAPPPRATISPTL